MISKHTHALTALGLIIAGAGLVAVMPLAAEASSFDQFFTLIATDESPKENIGVVLGFNAQQDPTGAAQTRLDLSNPSRPVLTNSSTGGAFNLLFVLKGLGTAVIPLPSVPNADGQGGFDQMIDGHMLDVQFMVGPGRVDAASWASFNPQPEPPGDVLGVGFQFMGNQDPIYVVRASLDGVPLTFASAPEPTSWALMLVGVAAIGGMVRRRAYRPAEAIRPLF